MTDWVQALCLGLVQGIAEFLPISSSGHLTLLTALMQTGGRHTFAPESAALTIALHFGTLLSIVTIYRRDIPSVIRDGYQLLSVIVATIPVGVVGLLFHDRIRTVFGTPLLIGFALTATAGLLLTGRRFQRPDGDTRPMNLRSAVVIGLFQAAAVVPGISRSGSTIAAGLICGLSRQEAARFSFLAAIPAIGGASLVAARDLLTGQAQFSLHPAAVLLGTVTAFVTGTASLSWLLRIVASDRLHWFAGYCSAVGLITILWQTLSG